jgi:hypothetical protein
MAKVWTILKKENGEIANKKAIRLLFDQLKDGKYTVEVNDSNQRSSPQNRYYWGLMIPMVQKGIKDLGTDLSKEETHEFLKARFNYSELVNENTGEVMQVPFSTTRLNKAEFGEYISKIQQFAAEFLNVVIPDPGQVLEINYE